MLINGKQFSWSSVTMEANGLPLPGLMGIDYDDSLTPGKVRGPNPDYHGFTTGQYDANCTIRILRLQFEAYKAALGGPGYMEREHAIVVSYFEPEVGVVTDTIVGRVGGAKTTNSDSPDPNVIEIPFQVTRPILWNGVTGVFPRL